MNGTQVASWSGDSTDIAKPSSHLYIGVASNGSSYDFLGWLSNVRVVKGTAVYTSGYTPPTTPATAIGPLPSKMERDPLVLQISLERVSISESILSEI